MGEVLTTVLVYGDDLGEQIASLYKDLQPGNCSLRDGAVLLVVRGNVVRSSTALTFSVGQGRDPRMTSLVRQMLCILGCFTVAHFGNLFFFIGMKLHVLSEKTHINTQRAEN